MGEGLVVMESDSNLEAGYRGVASSRFSYNWPWEQSRTSVIYQLLQQILRNYCSPLMHSKKADLLDTGG